MLKIKEVEEFGNLGMRLPVKSGYSVETQCLGSKLKVRKMNYRGGSLSAQEKMFAALPYTVSLMSGIPALELLADFFPALPIKQVLAPLLFVPGLLYSTLGSSANLIIFLGLYFFVVRNANIKHFIRYHTMQSLMIGIMVSLMGLASSLMGPVLGPLSLVLTFVVSAAVVVTSIYSMIFALMGNYTNIPLISDASEAQIRY